MPDSRVAGNSTEEADFWEVSVERYEYRGGPPPAEFVARLAQDRDALQAQLEAVQRERDEAKLYLTQERANRDSLAACVDRDVQKIKDLQAALDAERLKADTYMKSSAEWFIANRYTQQQQLDTERTWREQVEMANYAKDGQIETLQAERDRLREALEVAGDDICSEYCGAGPCHKKCLAVKAALTPAAGGGKP